MIEQVGTLPIDELAALRTAARTEGFGALERLVHDWESGENRFDRKGEALFAARVDGRLVGICGLNRDPFVDAGRVRRLFVLPAHRRTGVARALVAAVTTRATRHFSQLVGRTYAAPAEAFYESLGFEAVDGDGHTHRRRLDD